MVGEIPILFFGGGGGQAIKCISKGLSSNVHQ